MTKPLHAGIACRNGLVATLLAKAGWTANPAILETDNGFFKVFGCGVIKDLNNFGKPFHFLSPGVSLKRFPTCSATHLGIEAILALKRDHALTADQVESIECGVHALSPQALRQELGTNGGRSSLQSPLCRGYGSAGGIRRVEAFFSGDL